MVNGIVSWISLLDLLLLVYRSARDFCILILQRATSPNSLMSSSGFLGAPLGFSMYNIMSFTNSDSLSSSSLDSLYFFFFSDCHWQDFQKLCWIKVVRMDIRVLFLTLKEMFSVFQCWFMMFSAGLSNNAFILLKYILSMPIFWKVFIINSCWILSKVFLHLLRLLYGFYFSTCWCGLLHWLICRYWQIPTSLG